MNVGSSVSSSRSSECFQEVGNKEGMVKTLAKPMLHYRLLNCRASGLLEQSIGPKCSIGRFDLREFYCSHSVNAGVELNRFAYEPQGSKQ